jgi:hypothetical protein
MAEPVVKIPLAPQLPVTGITALVTPNGAANAVTVVNAIERPRGVENSAIRCIDQNVSRVLVLVTAVWNDPLDQWEGSLAMHTPTPDLAELAGSWRLLSHGTTYTDTNERLEVFGSKPDGRMVLTPAGRIMFLFMKANRQVPRSDADRAALLDGLVLIAVRFVWMVRGASSRRSIFPETRHGAETSCGCSLSTVTA